MSLFLIFFGAFLALLIVGVPIGVSLGMSSLAYITALGGIPLEVGIQRMIVAADSFPLLALPFFILSGNIMLESGISKKLVDFVDSLVGWISGGLSIVTVVSSMFFGAISGSCAATTAAIGGIMIPGMVEKGYSKEYAAGVAASSGILGAIIPPSLMMVTYGTLTGVSISSLFMGGFIPGVIVALVLIAVSIAIAKKEGFHSQSKFSFRNVLRTFKSAILAIMMPVIVLGGIYSGMFTPTEASVIAVVYTIIVGVFVYRTIGLKQLKAIFLESAKSSGGIMFMVCTANMFGWILARENIPVIIADAIVSVSNNVAVVLILINILLLIVGCFMDSIAAQLILTPILFPVVTSFGVDPLHFGIIVCINICIGTMTPPFGVNLFVASGITALPLESIAKKTMPFLLAAIATLMVLTFLPGVTTFLPNLL